MSDDGRVLLTRGAELLRVEAGRVSRGPSLGLGWSVALPGAHRVLSWPEYDEDVARAASEDPAHAEVDATILAHDGSRVFTARAIHGCCGSDAQGRTLVCTRFDRSRGIGIRTIYDLTTGDVVGGSSVRRVPKAPHWHDPIASTRLFPSSNARRLVAATRHGFFVEDLQSSRQVGVPLGREPGAVLWLNAHRFAIIVDAEVLVFDADRLLEARVP